MRISLNKPLVIKFNRTTGKKLRIRLQANKHKDAIGFKCDRLTVLDSVYARHLAIGRNNLLGLSVKVDNDLTFFYCLLKVMLQYFASLDRATY
ncbi:hypothetical protein D3C87_1794450 [compost metagenome]